MKILKHKTKLIKSNFNTDFTGEAWVPGKTPKRIEDDHKERYKFAANYGGERGY